MHPRSIRIAAVVVAIITVLSAGGAYAGLSKAAQQAATCSLATTSSIVVDQPEIPDSLDPAIVFTTPGWGIVQQVYQTLVFYNNSQYSPTAGPEYMEPLLAKNWTTSTNGWNWTFTLFPHEFFSNGDPLNAYVMWYSLNRVLVMNQPLVYLSEENFFLPGLTFDANSSAAIPSTQYNTQVWLAGVLNSFDSLSAVTNPSSSVLSVMEANNQSFQVINSTTIEFHIGAGAVDYNGPEAYPFLLDQLATPGYAAVDPLFVSEHGGVQVNAPNSYMSNNMMGSGPYSLTFWSPSTGYSIAPSKDYWAASIAPNYPSDNNMQPAKSPVDVSFQENPTIVVENMQTGAAALGSFAYTGPSLISELRGYKCLDVVSLPPVYGALSFSGWIYMDQNATTLPGEPVNPFANLSVRAAVVHAINYSQIIQVGFGGYGTQWVGPVPTGYPYYNPTNLPNYTFNVGLAERWMNASPWPMSSGGLNHLFPNGINFEYINEGDWATVGELLKADLAKVDIPLNLVPMSIDQLVEEQTQTTVNGQPACISQTSANSGPFYIGLDYYTGDYVGPDDPTNLNAWSEGGYNLCMSEFSSSQVDNWYFQAAASTNPALEAQLYGNITNYMYYNYTDAWLVIPTSFLVDSVEVQGIVQNPMGSGIGFQLIYNTDYLK